MAYLRCSSCGAKALRIATRCPSCGAAIQLRDERGQRIRLRRCRGCDIYVRREEAACPWCQTERRDVPWRAVAAAAVVLMLVGGGAFLLAGDPGWGDPGETAFVPQEEPSIHALRPAQQGEDFIPEAPSHPLPDAPFEDAPLDDPPAPPSPSTGPGEVVPTPSRADSDGDGSTPDRWSPAEAVTFVNVRANPDREADILGVVPESATVLLGDLRGGWRRIRAGDLSGWVDGRLFRMASSRE
jgi:hypothetical protein